MKAPDTMELFVLGTSQAVAPASLRERLHLDLAEMSGGLAHLLTQRGVLAEAVPLSTCARLELYALAPDPERAVRLIARLVGRRTGVPAAEVRAHGYVLRGDVAVRHLFRVAAGLESVVHGEAQILGQVREAAHHPLALHGKGPVLHRLFESALATGKRVRTETEIGRGAASLASASLSMLERDVEGGLGSKTALVLGAGETGALVARLLKKAGVGRLVIANRTEETARELASALRAEGRGLRELPDLLAEADVVVGAATASEPLVTAEMLVSAPTRPLRQHFLDLAHPRCFDRGLAATPGVRLIDLQAVFDRVEAAREARSVQVPHAERIVCEHAEAFVRWQHSRENVRVLRAMREQVLNLAREEAERLGRGRSEEERAHIARVTRSVARAMLHRPTVALRDADPRSVEGRALLDGVSALFGIHAEEAEPVGSS